LIQWLQSAWVGVVGGDDGAKDIRRILRLPGTQNVKKHWAPNFPTVCYEWANFGTVYSIDQIIAHLPPRPQKAEPQHRTITLQSGNGTAYGDDSVINRFNATYKVTDILDNNGYTGTGSERSRPGAPSSNGVNISDDGFVSWHWSSNDPLYNPKPDGNPHKTTSFTAFLVLEHGGNMKEAVKAAAELLGMGRERNNPLGAMNGDHQTSEELLASLQEVTASKRIDPDTGEILGDDGDTVTPNTKLRMSPGRRIKHTKDGVTRIVKIVALNTALTVDGGPNIYDAEYTDDADAWWPITVSDDDDIEPMTASAPKPTTPAAKPMTIDDVLSAINTIANNAELKPIDRQKQIARGLSGAIGDIDKSFHVEIIAALEVANAGFTQTGAKEFVRSAVADAKKRNKASERQRKEAARQNLLDVRAKKGKRSIDTGNRQLPDIVDEALQALEESNGQRPRIFVRNGALSRIVQDERGFYGIQEFNDRALLHELAAVADWETVGLDINGNPQSKAVDPPINVIREIFGRPGWPGFPALSGIVNAPVFSRDGTLHDQPGYSKSTRLFYTGGVKVGDTTPTPENIARSKDLVLNNLLVDFPFAVRS
jgi:hypothetical protein